MKLAVMAKQRASNQYTVGNGSIDPGGWLILKPLVERDKTVLPRVDKEL